MPWEYENEFSLRVKRNGRTASNSVVAEESSHRHRGSWRRPTRPKTIKVRPCIDRPSRLSRMASIAFVQLDGYCWLYRDVIVVLYT